MRGATRKRTRLTARLRMSGPCSKSAELALQLLVPGSGYVPNTAQKRPSDETGTTQVTGPRQACYIEKRLTRETEGGVSASCLRCSAQLSTVKECDLAALHSAGCCTLARPIMPSISLAVNVFIYVVFLTRALHNYDISWGQGHGIYEKYIYQTNLTRLDHLLTCHPISNMQCGSQARKSTVTAVLTVTDDWL